MAEDSLTLAFGTHDQGNIYKARALREALLRAERAYAPALPLAGHIAKRGNKFEAAVSLLERSVQNESNPKALAGLSDCLWRTGRPDHAARNMRLRQPLA